MADQNLSVKEKIEKRKDLKPVRVVQASFKLISQQRLKSYEFLDFVIRTASH